jgi:hypothetical protein
VGVVVSDASLCTHFGIFPPLQPPGAWLIFIRPRLRSHNTSIPRPFLLSRNGFSVSLELATRFLPRLAFQRRMLSLFHIELTSILARI